MGQWEPLETYIDTEKKIIWVEISGFSIYTVMVSTRPFEIAVEDLTINPGEIDKDGSTTVAAMLVNSGDFAGSYEATLMIDGVVAETKVVDVAKQGSAAVSFDLIGLAAGTHEITIGDAVGSLTVADLVEPTSPTTTEPEPEPEPMPTPEPTPEPETGEVAEIPTQEIPEEPESGNNWWIFGTVFGVCAVAIVAGILIYRRRRYY